MLNREMAELKAQELAAKYAGQVDDNFCTIEALLPLTRQLIVTQQALEAMQQSLDRDTLTGLQSRDAILRSLDVELRRQCRDGQPFSVLMLDLDHFKRVNDTHGHQMGDQVLKAVGAAIRKQLRATDHAGRYGGEELLVILTGSVNAHTMAQRLRATIAEESSRFGFPVSASIGGTTVHKRELIQDILERADRAMYRAKSLGRNRVHHAQ